MALEPIKVVVQAKDDATEVLKGIKNYVMGIGAAISAYAIGDFVALSVKSFGDLQDSIGLMNQSLINVGADASVVGTKMQGVFEANAKKLGYTVAEQADAYANLVRHIHDPEKATQALSEAMDVAAVKHIALADAAAMVARAHEGNAKAIKIVQNAQGAALVQASTFTGQLKIMGTEFITLKEHLGGAITQTDGFKEGMNAVHSAFTKVIAYIDEHANDIADFMSKVGAIATFMSDKVLPIVLSVASGIGRGFETVKTDVEIAIKQVEWGYLELEKAHARWEAFITFGDKSKWWTNMADGFQAEADKISRDIDALKYKFDHIGDPSTAKPFTVNAPAGGDAGDDHTGDDAKEKKKKDEAAKELERVLKAQHDLRVAQAKDHGGLSTQGTGNAGVNAANSDGAPFLDHFGGASPEQISASRAKVLTDAIEKQKKAMENARKEVQQYGEAWLAAFQAMGAGQNIFKELEKAASQTIANIAAKKGQSEAAEGVAALAAGTWPPNPAALAAAGKHFAAAALFEALAGAVGSVGSGGSGGGGGTSQAGANATTQMGAKGMSTGTIIIKGDQYLDTNNPAVMNAFVDALGNVKDKNIINISFQP